MFDKPNSAEENHNITHFNNGQKNCIQLPPLTASIKSIIPRKASKIRIYSVHFKNEELAYQRYGLFLDGKGSRTIVVDN